MQETEQINNSQGIESSNLWLYPAWVIALLGMVGSLFFSEVMQYPPCVLCWYQRIALYPLVVIIAVGIVLKDSRVRHYGLPFCIAGFAIAAYHNLLYYGIIPESITPCTQGVSCTAQQLELFGFITIPLLSLASFAVIGICLMLYRSKE
jgi:disulfide bond formation protein DsbB